MYHLYPSPIACYCRGSPLPLISHKRVTIISPAAIDMQDVTAEVEPPTGPTLPAELVAVGNDTCCVRFVPTEMGLHHVSVKHRGVHLPGSPFPYTVGPLGEGGASKVKAGGPGLEGALAGEPGTLDYYYHYYSVSSAVVAPQHHMGSFKIELPSHLCHPFFDGGSDLWRFDLSRRAKET